MGEYRIERDSMGELKVPADALYGAQTQRAVDNFPISGLTMPRQFIRALGLIKSAAAQVNSDLGHLSKAKARTIRRSAERVAAGEFDRQFPIDVFQTGSGTSSNMNANEVIAHLASAIGSKVHPNDDVNMGQSSNDVIPTAIQVSAALTVSEQLLPDYDVVSWLGFTAPAGLPPAMRDRWHDAFRQAMARPAVKDKLEELGNDTRVSTPAEFRARVEADMNRWRPLAHVINQS